MHAIQAAKARGLALIGTLAGGEEPGGLDLLCDGSFERRAAQAALAGAAQLGATVNSSCLFTAFVPMHKSDITQALTAYIA